jgi:DNA invertase Pin-like site-specific DNA recombinase
MKDQAGDDSPMNTLLLSMLGAVAEFERSMIFERPTRRMD